MVSSTDYIDILVFNGDLLNEVTSVKAKTVKALRTELNIPDDEQVTVGGRNVADGFRLQTDMAVAWGLQSKSGG